MKDQQSQRAWSVTKQQSMHAKHSGCPDSQAYKYLSFWHGPLDAYADCVLFVDFSPSVVGYLRGVDVINHTSFTYTGRPQTFEWVDHGFRLHLPENALPLEECRVHVKASFSGQFQFSDDTELISGIYWIATPHVFTKPVTVEIQHCSARTVHPSSLTYIVAKCTQEDLPYKFNPLSGGVFVPSSRYGSISLTHFSGLGITSRSPRRPSLVKRLAIRRRQVESKSSDVKSYCARLYYSSSGIHSWEVYFAITLDLELHVAVSPFSMISAVCDKTVTLSMDFVSYTKL